MFTDPQLGRVGMMEAEAQKLGKNIQVAKIPMSEVARGIETDEMRGFLKAVVDADTQQILGAAIPAVEGGGIMATLGSGDDGPSALHGPAGCDFGASDAGRVAE